MKKQLKNTIRAYLCAIMLVVYIIGVVTIAQVLITHGKVYWLY